MMMKTFGLVKKTANMGVRRGFSQSASRRIGIPIVSEGQGGYDIFSRLLKERIICVYGPIDDQTAGIVTAQLLYLEAQSRAKVYMYINSPGGSVTSGLAIYDTMQYVGCPISTVCLGQACSMGSLLLCGGEPGERLVLRNSVVMVHQPSGGFSGSASDVAIHAEHMAKTRAKITQLYLHHMEATNADISAPQLDRLLDRDSFLDADRAVELGLADRVLRSRNEL